MADPTSPSGSRVFLSYSRKDSAFIDELIVSVESYGFEVVFDREDLFPGEPWEPRLHRMITDADTTVCVVSKNWVASEQCVKELTIALRQGRRVIPIIIDPVNPSEMPADLARLQFVFFYGDGHSYARGVVDLINTLKTDIGWVREQSRLLDKADEWASQNRSAMLLLRGEALERAMAWVNGPAPRDTRVLPMVSEFIEASRSGQDQDEKQRLRDRARFAAVGFAAAIFGLIGTASLGYLIYDKLQTTQGQLAETGEKLLQTTNLVEGDSADDMSLVLAETAPGRGPASEPEPAAPDLSATDDQIPKDGAEEQPPPPGKPDVSSDRARALAAQLNSPERTARLQAGQEAVNWLRTPDSGPLLTALVEQLQPPNFENLSPSGRVNVLYMLNAYDGWGTAAQAKPLAGALADIEGAASKSGGAVVIGGQARDCIDSLKRKLDGQTSVGDRCGGK
jgi:hypothetical protein